MSKEKDQWAYDTFYGGAFRVDKRVFAFSRYCNEQNKAAIEAANNAANGKGLDQEEVNHATAYTTN